LKQITLIQGDITTANTDAIVNAASRLLLGGGGVDGAIHLAAGPELLEECKRIKHLDLGQTQGLLPTGQAVITKGYNLPAKHVIHTVGPIFCKVDNPGELLKNAYSNSLRLAEENNISSIAFPSIGTGVYGCPVQWAAEIALSTIQGFMANAKIVKDVQMVLFTAGDFNIFQHARDDLIG
jgi:O-acetyl-ADP-ribose deacetylase